MKVKSLLNKLKKLGIEYKKETQNDYNIDICFEINGKKFVAGYEENGKEQIDLISTVVGYDDAIQETSRRWFETFPQVLRYANKQ